MEMKFDSTTGEPVTQESVQESVQEPTQGGGFDPMTGQPMTGPSTSGGYVPPTGKILKGMGATAKIAIGVACAVVVVGIVAFAGIRSGAFMGSHGKILKAVENTFEAPAFLEDMDYTKLISSDTYTLAVKGEADGVSLDMTYAQAKSKQQISGSIDGLGMDMELVGLLDDKQLRVSLPFVNEDTILVYNYTQENDEILENFGIDPESLNETLKTVNAGPEESQVAEEVSKRFMDFYNELEFEKLDKESFEVDGKDVSCGGYKTTVKGEDLQELLYDISELLQETAGDTTFGLDEMDEMDELDEMDIRIYLYKNKLACLELEVDDSELSIQFQGGERRTQNMVVELDGMEVLEIEGSTEKDMETIEITSGGQRILELEYNKKSGDVELTVNVDGDEAYVEGKIESSRKSVVVTLDSIRVDGENLPVEGSITITSDAEITEVTGEEELDIGTASQEDLMEYLNDYLGY